MEILITGGTGLIGRHLVPRLLALGHRITVITRDPDKARTRLPAGVTLLPGLQGHLSHLNNVDAVINLAGEPIADRRWTTAQKQRLCESRWEITAQLVELFHASTTPPEVLISGSAMGYYGDLGDIVVTEDEPPHKEFTHHLCARWEHIAGKAQRDGTRVCLLRTGVVLTSDGGMLAKLLPLFRLGLGGPIGNGRQYLSWIHMEDMIAGIIWLLTHPLSGPFNMVSPCPVHNGRFSHILGKVLHRPALIRAPAAAVKLLMGESSVLVLGGQRGLPKRLEDTGFTFRWHDLEQALGDLTNGEKP